MKEQQTKKKFKEGACDICNRTSNEVRIDYSPKYNMYLCPKHYRQLNTYGKVIRTIYDKNEIVNKGDFAEIILYNKQCEEIGRALIDVEDIERCKDRKWCLARKSTGIYVRNEGKRKEKSIYLHSYIMNAYNGEVIDHINGDTFDNRKQNLRICTQKENSLNTKTSSVNTSGVKGVFFNKNRNKWYGSIIYDKHTYYLGCYKDKIDIILVRLIAEFLLYKNFSRLYNKLKVLFEPISEQLNLINMKSDNIHKILRSFINENKNKVIDNFIQFLEKENIQYK